MSRLIATFLLLSALLPQARAVELPGLAGFIDEMVQRHQFDRTELEAVFAQANHRQIVIDTLSRPFTRKPWPDYRATFVEPRQIRRGLAFWQQHQPVLAQAEQQYGVPAEIIVALIGIETVYGRHTGKFPTLDVLATLAFDYPRRAEFFRGELEQFLLLTREQRLDAQAVRGSYAGALGIPQFMPGSYRKYAVDFNRDGKLDLLNDPEDAIGSVANYLQQYGWRRGEPVTVRLAQSGDSNQREIGATRKLSEWAAAGVSLTETLSIEDCDARLLGFADGDDQEYWLAFANFQAITHYNHSSYYAMTVFQLAQALHSAHSTPSREN
jgi:membrane-bound lytic murein transglycosylase B